MEIDKPKDGYRYANTKTDTVTHKIRQRQTDRQIQTQIDLHKDTYGQKVIRKQILR